MKTFGKILKYGFRSIFILGILFGLFIAVFYDTNTEIGKTIRYYDHGCLTDAQTDSIFFKQTHIQPEGYPDHWLDGTPFYLHIDQYSYFLDSTIIILVDTDENGVPGVLSVVRQIKTDEGLRARGIDPDEVN